mgnify:CR=1 FL=1
MARYIEDQILLDEKTSALKAIKLPQPRTGWIRTIRTALRMSQAELATILQMNQKSLHALETSEANSKIRLESLEKVANALDCDLVYAFVPRQSLHDRYTDRAHVIAAAQLASVENTMQLENQSVTFAKKKVDALAKQGTGIVFMHYAVHPDAKLGRDGNRTVSSLYDLITASKDKRPNRIGDWNNAYVVTKGTKVEHWLNGRLVVSYDRSTDEFRELVKKSKYADPKYGTNFGEWESGHILLQEHGDEVWFKNVKIRDLSK